MGTWSPVAYDSTSSYPTAEAALAAAQIRVRWLDDALVQHPPRRTSGDRSGLPANRRP